MQVLGLGAVWASHSMDVIAIVWLCGPEVVVRAHYPKGGTACHTRALAVCHVCSPSCMSCLWMTWPKQSAKEKKGSCGPAHVGI